jgi:hypothetical protein
MFSAQGRKTQVKSPSKKSIQVVKHHRPDQAQRGRLADELEALNQRVIFYPKFYCELNFIERFWCSAKFYARENCGYSLDALRKTVPEALHSISSTMINRYYKHCMRI